MEIRKVALDKLKPTEYNPRVISEEELRKLEDSILEYGYIEPIVWNERTGNIVGGHQRYKILRKMYLGDKEVDVVVVNLSDSEEKALNIAFNKITGSWDEYALTNLLKEIGNESPELLEDTGFTEGELKNLLQDSFEIKETEIQNTVAFYFDDYEEFMRAKNFFKGSGNKLKELICK
jgi:ParB-like chromosome segregation protein Spo0J